MGLVRFANQTVSFITIVAYPTDVNEYLMMTNEGGTYKCQQESVRLAHRLTHIDFMFRQNSNEPLKYYHACQVLVVQPDTWSMN